MKSSIAVIHASLAPAAANPLGLGRPYRSLNPPGARGAPKTGLPAIISFMNFVIGWTFFDLNSVFFFASESSLPLFANLEIKSQPGTFSRSVCFCIFGAFKHKPSPITSKTPPLILDSSIFLTFP